MRFVKIQDSYVNSDVIVGVFPSPRGSRIAVQGSVDIMTSLRPDEINDLLFPPPKSVDDDDIPF